MKKVLKVITNEYVILLGLIVLAFLVRFYKIDNPIADWHSFRQADTASVSRVYVEEGINILIPRYHDVSSIQSGWDNPKGYRFVELPLYNVIHAGLVKVIPIFTLEVWGRLLSIISSLISGLILYLLGKRFIGKWGGLLAFFFFAFIPYNIYFSRVILPEPLATTLALGGLLLFVRYIDSGKRTLFYISAVVFALSILVKPFTVFYFIPIFYLYIDKYGLKRILTAKHIIPLSLYGLIMAIPFLAWRTWINDYSAGIPFVKWVFNGNIIRFRPAFWRWIFGERLGRLILGIWGILPFTLGILWVKRKGKYFIHSFLLGMFLYVSVVATANVQHDYYQVFIIPAVSLALAQGSVFLLRTRIFPQVLAKGMLVFSVMMMMGIGLYQVKEYYKINHPEIIVAGQAVDKLVPKDARVIAPYNGDTAFLYQTKRWGWPAVDDSIENIIRRGASYYVSVNLHDKDTEYVRENYEVIEETDSYIIIDLSKEK